MAEEEEKLESKDGINIFSLHAGYETDGDYTNAFLARPAEGTGLPGVVLLSGMGGLKQTLFSGEGLVMNFKGRGKVWLQTRTLGETAGSRPLAAGCK